MKFAEKTVEEFLFTPGKSFIIPEFQRPYSWQANNVREYLADLEESINNDRSHYFGSVVFVLDDIDSSSIIDGQQRITTSLLMIMAIYHLLKKNPSQSERMTAQDIQEKYLVNRNQTNRVKLRTVTTDNAILQKIYDVDGDDEKLTQDEKLSNLYQAYAEFLQYFATKPALDKYITGLGKFEIITIALDPRDDNPQRVFESINSTGRPLSDGDKIRNFALMLKNDTVRQRVYNKYWISIERSLVDVGKDPITDFFRSYIMSKKQTIVRFDAVYPEFKKLFAKNIDAGQSEEKIDSFYGDIVANLEYFLFCKLELDPSNKYQSIKDEVFKMRYIQIDLYLPYAISVLAYYNEGHLTNHQLKDIFKLIETYFSRRIVCGLFTTSVDRYFAGLHKDILMQLELNPGTDYVDILKYIMINRVGPTRLPSDLEFENAIKNNPTYNQRASYVNYILSAIDDTSKESDLLRQIANRDLKLSIEHVMPQTLNKEWEAEIEGGASKEEYEGYLHTLANLTLSGYNSEYQNYSFDRKKSMSNGFTESKLGINRWIAQQEKWNIETLRRRQQWWISNLQKVWPMPTTSFTPIKEDSSVHLLDDLNLKGTTVISVTIFGEHVSVSSWAEAIDAICEKLYDRYDDFADKIFENEFTSRYFTRDASKLFNPSEIYDSGIFCETGTDTNRKLKIIQVIAEIFNISRSDLVAELSKPLKDNGYGLREEMQERVAMYQDFLINSESPNLIYNSEESEGPFVRFNSNYLNEILPQRQERDGGWKTGKCYYYEIVVKENGKDLVQLAFNNSNSTSQQQEGMRSIFNTSGQDKGSNWSWHVHCTWPISGEDYDERIESLQQILQVDLQQQENSIKAYISNNSN